MSPQLHQMFPGFYDNLVVTLLADAKRWTISDKDKRPIDFPALFGENTDDGNSRIRGAFHTDQRCLVSLQELTTKLPTAANHAFYLQAQTDGVVVLDIEPTCPPTIRDTLLELPALYAERSMSGRGYHLVLPLPENFYDYPVALEKPVLQDTSKHFEVLLKHWITFTRKTIPYTPWDITAPSSPRWEMIYGHLAANAKPSSRKHLDISDQKPDIPHEAEILSYLNTTQINKSLDDFNRDYSRYEFSVLGTIYNHLIQLLSHLTITGVIDDPDAYDETMRIWLMYQAATNIIEHRPKHDEVRSGMPLLFDRAVFVYAGRTSEEAKRHHDQQVGSSQEEQPS